jgi:transposase-like protein
MSLLTPERQAQVSLWRQQAIDGTLSLEDMKAAVLVLREGRMGAAAASDASRTKKAKKVVKTADELLGELKF